jgi:chaperone modulatory protein CbpM
MTPARRLATQPRLIHRSDEIGGGLVELRVLAREAGVHPAAVSRFVALGLVEPRGGTPDRPLYARDAAALLASAARLRRDLGLNYAGAALACELLVRIERLELRLEAAAQVDEVDSDPDAGAPREPPPGSGH